MTSEWQQPMRYGLASSENIPETPTENQSSCHTSRRIDFDTPNTVIEDLSLRETKVDDPYENLPDDVYSFIALCRAPSPAPRSKPTSALIAVAVFSFQIFGLVLMILSKVHPSWSENEDIDNPHPYFFNAMKSIDSFIPTNESCLVQMSQVFAALAFIVSQEQDTLSDIVQSFDILLSVLFGNQKSTDCCFTISWCLRLTQGTIAAITAVLLGLSSSDVVDIILNFTAINYISGIDERVFDMAHDGWLGEDARIDARYIKPEKKYIVRHNGIQTDDTRVEQEEAKVLKRGAAWIAIGWLFFWFFLPILVVFGVQNHTDVMATRVFRVRFDEENLRSYSGCYNNTGKRSHRRFVYAAGNDSNPGAIFSYCRPEKKWYFLKENMDPCSLATDDTMKDKEGAHTAGVSFAFDIQTTFESQWVSSHNRHLDIHFIEKPEGEDEEDFCAAEIGDGICDKDLNFFDYEYDGGDCCATTCISRGDNVCGDEKEPVFGAQSDHRISFPYCKDEDMIELPLTLETFEYNNIGAIQNVLGDRNTSRFKWENESLVETEWENFWRNQTHWRPTIELVCNEKRVFFVQVEESMKKEKETPKLNERSSCSLIMNTFEPIVKINVTWPSDLSNSEIHVKKVIRNTIPSAIGYLTQLPDNKIRIDLSNGNLEGTIPKEIGLLKESIEQLELGSNSLSGTIPTELGDLGGLKRLVIDHNYALKGTIPSDLFSRDSKHPSLQNLTILDLGFNSLTGTIPTEIGLSTKLTALKLNNNDLRGIIPNTIGNLKHLEILDLSSNFLTGEIPKEIELLTNLKYIDLVGDNGVNNLHGSINCTELPHLDFATCARNFNQIYNTPSPTLSASPSTSPSISTSPSASTSPSIHISVAPSVPPPPSVLPIMLPSATPTTASSSPSLSPTFYPVPKILCNDSRLRQMCRIMKSIDGMRDHLQAGNWTVFAFTDDAFEKLLQQHNITEELEKKIFEFHIAPGKNISVNDFSCQGLIEMLNGKDTRTKCDDNGNPIGQKGSDNEEPVLFIEFDLEASNGAIHIIDGVLLYSNFYPDNALLEDDIMSLQLPPAPILRLEKRPDP